MAAFETTITINDKLTGPLARLRDAGGNLTQPMADIAAAVHDNTLDRFAQAFDPDGIPWEYSKRSLRDGGKTLFKSGDLYRAIQPESGETFAQIGVIATGGPAIYAKAHQYGLSGTQAVKEHARTITKAFGKALPEAKVATVKSFTRHPALPARPYLGIESRDLTDIERIVLAHLTRAADGKGASA